MQLQLDLTKKLSNSKSDLAIYISQMWQYSNLLLKSCQYLICGLSKLYKGKPVIFQNVQNRKGKYKKKRDFSLSNYTIKTALIKRLDNKQAN